MKKAGANGNTDEIRPEYDQVNLDRKDLPPEIGFESPPG